MVSLTVTPAAKAAIDAFLGLEIHKIDDEEQGDRLAKIDIGSQVEHQELVTISRHLVQHSGGIARQWRLEALLKGSTIYQPPPPPKPEPVRTLLIIKHDALLTP